MNKNIICGIHSIENYLINKPNILKEVFIQKDSKNIRFSSIKKMINKHNIHINYVDKKWFKKEFLNIKTQGIAAIISNKNNIIKYYNKDLIEYVKKNKNDISILILNNITDNRNIGSCLRNAEAFDIDIIIIPEKKYNKINNTIISKNSCGSSNIKIFSITKIDKFIEYIKSLGIFVYGTSVNETKNINLTKLNFNTSLAIVMGSESIGLNNHLLNLCDKIINISTNRKNMSALNVSVSTGIILYEIYKQKKLNIFE